MLYSCHLVLVCSHPLLVHIRHPSVLGTVNISIAKTPLTLLPTFHILGTSKGAREAPPPCSNILYSYRYLGWLAVALPLQSVVQYIRLGGARVCTNGEETNRGDQPRARETVVSSLYLLPHRPNTTTRTTVVVLCILCARRSLKKEG